MEGQHGLTASSGKRASVAWIVGVALAGVAMGLVALAWAGDRVATVLIGTLVRVMLWGFGFGWLKSGGF